MPAFAIGQSIAAQYMTQPCPKANQFKPGDVIEIRDSQTKKLLAEFRVSETDEREVKGPVVTSYEVEP